MSRPASSLQRAIDKTLSLRKAVHRLLDRPGLRPVLGAGASVYSVVRRGQLILVMPEDDLWVHRFPDAYLVHLAIETTPPAILDAVTRDQVLHGLDLAAGDVVVDVGAGVGTELLTFARAVGPRGRVVAIEAHPKTARCLARTSALNRFEHVDVLAAAATETECEIGITDDDNYLRSRLSEASATTLRVPGVPLEKVLRERGIDRVDLLKMNIEGAELGALRGLGDALRCVRQVAISCHDFLAPDTDPADWRRTFEPVQRLLEGAGFEVWSRPADPRVWVRQTLYGRRPTR